MKSHDLNAITRTIAQQRGVSYAEARRILSARAHAARSAKASRLASDSRRAGRTRAIADRISP